jgi:hypothetical protein
MRNRPEDVGLRPYGDLGTSRPDVSHRGNPIMVAFRALSVGARSRDFWLIGGGYFVCGATTNGLIGTHLIAACVDHGLSEIAGAGLLATTGVFALLGGTLAGCLSDRWDNRLLLCAYYGFSGPVAPVSAIRLRYVDLRPTRICRRLWPRLDRQRTADRAAHDRRCRP